MNRLTSVKTIILACLVCVLPLKADQSDSTDTSNIRNSIIQSLSRNYQEYLGYQSFAVEMHRNYITNRATANAPELHFLGGKENSHDIIINGLSFCNPITGVADISISNSFLSDINIYNQNIPIKYANANSAVIELSSPYLSKGIHSTFETFSDNLVGNSTDQNYYRGTLSGSLLTNDKLKFWTAFERKWLGDRMPSSHTPDALTSSPDILPNNQLSGWTYHGKLQYDISNKSLLTITTDGATDEWQEYLHFYNNPSDLTQINHTPRSKDETYGINATLEHKLSDKTSLSLSYGYFKSERIKGDGVIFDDLESYERYFDFGEDFGGETNLANPEYDPFNLFVEGDSLFLVHIEGDSLFFDTIFTIDTTSLMADTTYSYSGYDTTLVDTIERFDSHIYDDYVHHISSYKQLRGEIHHTLKNHNFTAGLLYKKYSLRYYRNLRPTLEGNESRDVNRYGFDASGNISDDESFKNSTKHPIELSFYISDEIKFDKVTLNAGVRFDSYDNERLKSLERPFDPEGNNPTDITIDEADLVPTKTKTTINPNFKIDIHATETSNLYFNWSLTHQIAPYGKMYKGWDFFEKIVASGSYFLFPNSSLDPLKTTKFSAGYAISVSNNTSIDFNFFHIENEKEIGLVYQVPSFPSAYSTYGNKGTTKFRGINYLFQYDDKKNIGLFLDVTTSIADGTNSSVSGRNIAWKQSQYTPQSYLLDFDKNYKIVTGVSLKTLSGTKFTWISKIESGYPYTPMQVYDVFSRYSIRQEPKGAINSVTTDKTHVVDFKIERVFKFSKSKVTVFVLVKNLLDKQIITGVYDATGSPTNNGYLESGVGRGGTEEFNSRYKVAQNNPLNFSAPRQIFFGLKASF